MERSGCNDHWQQMKDIMTETAQDICGMIADTRKRGGGMWRLQKQLGIRR